MRPGTQEAPKLPAGGLVSVMAGAAQRGAALVCPEGQGSPGAGGGRVGSRLENRGNAQTQPCPAHAGDTNKQREGLISRKRGALKGCCPT